MSVKAKLADVLLELPSRSELVYRIARRIVNRRQGENDGDITRNGELRLLRAVLPKARVVFDVGANVGDWTEAALAINSALQIHCFEPSPATFKVLASHRFPADVHLNAVGLGAEAGMVDFFVFGEAMGANSLYNRQGTDAVVQRKETVAITTLDDYAATQNIAQIDFVKVDVEGHEAAVIKGARRLLDEGRIGMLQFEYGGSYIDARVLLKDIYDLVSAARARYRFFKIMPHGLQPMPEYRQTFENFQYANFLMVREGVEVPR